MSNCSVAERDLLNLLVYVVLRLFLIFKPHFSSLLLEWDKKEKQFYTEYDTWSCVIAMVKLIINFEIQFD